MQFQDRVYQYRRLERHFDVAQVIEDIPIPQVIEERFEFQSVLGTGGFGLVISARDLVLERDVAIKFLKIAAGSEAAALPRFQREAKVLAQMEHRNLVSIYSYGVLAERYPYIVMEKASGTKLRDLIINDSIETFEMLQSIYCQICDALEYAHARGVLHRDLTPANVCVNIENNQTTVKIIDFGLAHILNATGSAEKITRTGMVVGNVFYMSPEQCQGRPLSPSSDIYSLGCIFYETLSGEVPHTFKSGELSQNSHAVLNLMPPSPSVRPQFAEHSVLVKAIALRCLQKSAGDRFSSCAEISECLTALKPPSPGSFAWSSVVPSSTALEWTRNSRAVSVAVVLTLLTICGAAITNDALVAQMISRTKNSFAKLSPKTELELAQFLSRFSHPKSALEFYQLAQDNPRLAPQLRLPTLQGLTKVALDSGYFVVAAKSVEAAIDLEPNDRQWSDTTMKLANRCLDGLALSKEKLTEPEINIRSKILANAAKSDLPRFREQSESLQRRIMSNISSLPPNRLAQLANAFAAAVDAHGSTPNQRSVDAARELGTVLISKGLQNEAVNLVHSFDRYPELAKSLIAMHIEVTARPELLNVANLKKIAYSIDSEAGQSAMSDIRFRTLILTRAALCAVLLGDSATGRRYTTQVAEAVKALKNLAGEGRTLQAATYYGICMAEMGHAENVLTSRKASPAQFVVLKEVAEPLIDSDVSINGHKSLGAVGLRYLLVKHIDGETVAEKYLADTCTKYTTELCDMRLRLQASPSERLGATFPLLIVASKRGIPLNKRIEFLQTAEKLLTANYTENDQRTRATWLVGSMGIAGDAGQKQTARAFFDLMLKDLTALHDAELTKSQLWILFNNKTAFAVLTPTQKEQARALVRQTIESTPALDSATVTDLKRLISAFS